VPVTPGHESRNYSDASCWPRRLSASQPKQLLPGERTDRLAMLIENQSGPKRIASAATELR
jgi:hypothetical protein